MSSSIVNPPTQAEAGARPPRSIRVAIIVGVRLYRESVADALSRRPQLALVATGSDPVDAPAIVRDERPDVVLLDPMGADGPAIVRAARRAHDRVRVVVLGIDDRSNEVLALLEAGAAGYVAPEASIDELVDVACSAADGNVVCSPRAVRSLAERLTQLSHARSERRLLTPREREVAALIGQGLSNKQIAHQLQIEVATVKNHVHHILAKLQVERRGVAASLLRGAQPNAWDSATRSAVI